MGTAIIVEDGGDNEAGGMGADIVEAAKVARRRRATIGVNDDHEPAGMGAPVGTGVKDR